MEPSVFVGLQVTGSSAVVQDGREAVLLPGDLALYDTTRPYTLLNRDGIHQHYFRIPRAELALSEGLLKLATAVPFSRRDPLADLTGTCLRRIARQQARPAATATHDLEAAGRPGIELPRALIAARLGDHRTAFQGADETLCLRVMDYVRAHLGDHDAEVFLAMSGSTSGELILLAPLIALYTVADVVERRPALFLGCGAVAALAVVHAVHKPSLLGPQNLAFIALGGLAIAAGDSSRNRRAYLAEAEQRAERAEREREQDARRRIAEERLRIARDLHDAVGHQLALISVQSNVAGQALDDDTATAREALAHVKSASRRALGELRDTVTLLRQPGEIAVLAQVARSVFVGATGG